MYTAGTWCVSIAVPDELIERPRAVAPDWIAPERYGFVTELFQGGTEGITTLDFEVDVPDAAELHRLAGERWLALLRRAGLETQEPAFVSFLPPTYDARHEILRRDAQALIDEQHYDFAVLRLQTSLEVLAAEAIADALRGAVGRERGDALAPITKANMNDRVTGPVLGALIGHRPDRAAWWNEYRAHLARRNRIAHAGAQVTRAEAEASAAVVDSATRWLKDIWAGRAPESLATALAT